jgi:hypothetical protein
MIQHNISAKKALAVLNICLLTAVLLHSILRDIQLEKHYWFWLQYILLASITLLMISFAVFPIQKLLIINTGILLTCTEARKMLTVTRQCYLTSTFWPLLMAALIMLSDWKKPAFLSFTDDRTYPEYWLHLLDTQASHTGRNGLICRNAANNVVPINHQDQWTRHPDG